MPGTPFTKSYAKPILVRNVAISLQNTCPETGVYTLCVVLRNLSIVCIEYRLRVPIRVRAGNV